jgi:hypothetical protein
MRSDDRSSDLKLTMSQDKLFDILLHAATREDIARLDVKIDQGVQSLRSEITRLDGKIEDGITRLEGGAARLDGKIDDSIARLDGSIARLDAKIDKITYGIVLAILVPVIVQVILHFFHWS